MRDVIIKMSPSFDYQLNRPVTCEMIERAESGEITWEALARDMMNWVTDNQVHDMAEANGYIVYEDE
jgi:DNA-binding transcriptional regulator YdaS (Cro superfamily)